VLPYFGNNKGIMYSIKPAVASDLDNDPDGGRASAVETKV
jgi:hypothetical protein